MAYISRQELTVEIETEIALNNTKSVLKSWFEAMKVLKMLGMVIDFSK